MEKIRIVIFFGEGRREGISGHDQSWALDVFLIDDDLREKKERTTFEINKPQVPGSGRRESGKTAARREI